MNSILRATEEHSLAFGTVATGGGNGVVNRQISLRFTGKSYETAKQVLKRLHDSVYRCMIDTLSISMGDGGGAMAVSAALVFFEYQEK